MSRKVNIIVVFNQNKSKILMCKRKKEPFIGLYNFVGGKIEANENHLSAAYRELEEETNITSKDIELIHFMDFTYYHKNTLLEVYVGILKNNVYIHGNENQLAWIELTDDFCNTARFAGNGNIYHIINELELMMSF